MKKHFKCPECHTDMGQYTDKKVCPKKCILTQRVEVLHEKLVTPNPCMKCFEKLRQKNEVGANNEQSRKEPQVKFEPKEQIQILKRSASASSKHSSQCSEPSGNSDTNSTCCGTEAQESILSALVRNSYPLPPVNPETIPGNDTTFSKGCELESSSEKKSQGRPVLPKIFTDFPAVLVSEPKPESEPISATEYFYSVASQPKNAPLIERQEYKSIADFAAQRKLANACAEKAESVHQLGLKLTKKLSYYEGIQAALDGEMARLDEKLDRLRSIHLKLIEKSWGKELEEEIHGFAALQRAEKEEEDVLRANGWIQDIAYAESRTVGYTNGAVETVAEELWEGLEDVCADDPNVAWLDFRRNLTITERTYFQDA